MDILKMKEKLKEDEYLFTRNINHAIYILSDGTLIDGEFDYGSRGLDHRMIESVTTTDRYDNNFWDEVHGLDIVRLVPETNTALIKDNQILTPIQRKLLSSTRYSIEKY